MEPAVIRPARELRREVLWELLGMVRRESALRGELLPGEWVDTTTEEVLAGRREAWVVGEGPAPSALALVWSQPNRAFAHFHTGERAEGVDALQELARAVIDRLPAEVVRLDASATGLAPEQERALGEGLRRSLGFEPILRHAMVRPLSMDDLPPEPKFPPGFRLTTTGRVELGELAALDWRAYLGTADEALLSDSPEVNREMLDHARGGQFGRFLDDASPAVRGPTDVLAGFVVTCAKTIREAVFFDIAVDPSARRQGIGRALILRGLRGLLALGYSTAHLWVTETNVPARALYETVGFRAEMTAAVYRWYRQPRRSAGAPH